MIGCDMAMENYKYFTSVNKSTVFNRLLVELLVFGKNFGGILRQVEDADDNLGKYRHMEGVFLHQ